MGQVKKWGLRHGSGQKGGGGGVLGMGQVKKKGGGVLGMGQVKKEGSLLRHIPQSARNFHHPKGEIGTSLRF